MPSSLMFTFIAAVLFSPALILASPSDIASGGVAALGAGVSAQREGRHEEAARALTRALRGKLHNADYARFFLAESLRAQGKPQAALPHYDAVAKTRESRFAAPAAWQAADSLWQAGKPQLAARRYEKLLRDKKPGGDIALALHRLASVAADWPEARERPRVALQSRAASKARALLERLLTEHPGHALGASAAQRLAILGGRAPTPQQASASVPGEGDEDAEEPGEAAPPDGEPLPPALDLSPAALLRRAEILSDRRRWADALAEIDRLPTELPPALVAERDFLRGKTKYRSRRDYAGASKLLLGVVDALSGEKAAWAAFHGARALSRVDRDDEAIAGYRRMIERFPRSRWAPEARFLAGWLEWNRGQFAAAQPDLERTLRDYPRDKFSASAAWYLALAFHFLGKPAQARDALAAFENRAHLQPGLRPVERVLYWRARFLHDGGDKAGAQALWRSLVEKAPFAWYGLLAARRLLEMGAPDPLALPARTADLPPPDARARKHRAVLRIDELLAAQLKDDAGLELERGADRLLRDLGRARGFSLVLDRALATARFARAHSLAEILGRPWLDARPEGDVRTIWRVAYPLAHKQLVDEYGPPAGNPPHLLHAIMRKESGFDPTVVSYADARGLLQMIPPTSERVARELGVDYQPDRLFEPALNVRLGATYIGALHRKFKEQAPLTAGAFNAGPRSMKRWCDRFAAHPIDEFVELVSYAQTREYIKRVMHNYARYRYLYDKDRYLPPLTLDCAYRNDGPEY